MSIMSTFTFTHIIRSSSNEQAEKLARHHNLPPGLWLRLPFMIEDHHDAVYQLQTFGFPTVDSADWEQMDEAERRTVSSEDYFKLYLIVATSMAEAEKLASEAMIARRAWAALATPSINSARVYKMLPEYSEAN